MSDRQQYLGIDLGTTNSAAAVFDGSQVQLVRNAQGATLTPSVIRVDGKGAIIVGAKARRLIERDPDNVRGEFKRLMGTGQRIEFVAAKRSFAPEELAAEVLRSLRADVQEQFGFAPARAVVCVPALFELPQSSATSDAARLAGFERVELIQEPIASALAAGWTTDDAAGAWMVYDLGGGTFDASLLETRDGLLRVVGHDGDNFLGGRDFDWALVDHVLAEVSKAAGVTFERADPAIASGLRRLKLGVEDAKIELTRAETAEVVLPALALGDEVVDVEVTLSRDDVARLCLPLVDRSIAVCLRLLAAHGLEPAQVAKLVLVGGPTVMPILRQRLAETLGAPFGAALDPMTLVAQGAALYAASAGLDARPKPAVEEAGRRVWLQYPAMTSDLTPYVVGRLVEEQGPSPASVQLERQDGWKSPEATIDGEGAFVVAVDVLPKRPNDFRITGRDVAGKPVALRPARITIVQGLTLGDPPLSRTIGVATADDAVRVYVERGAPLPARRSFRLETVDTLVAGRADSLLRVPIVQGEYEHAHLCRLVGALEIRGTEVKATLPVGAEVELTIEVDRGGRLTAKAQVVSTGQVFENVAHLVVPDATPEALESSLTAIRERLSALRASAFRHGLAKRIAELGELAQSVAEAERDVAAAHGGDADAAQKARRTLTEIDARLDAAESDTKFPELEDEAASASAWASSWVSEYGTPGEQKLLQEAIGALEKARGARQVVEVQRRRRQILQLGNAAYFRYPDAWRDQFEYAAADVHEARDLPKAEKLVAEGRTALASGDLGRVRAITQQLWKLMPADAKSRRLGHDSGLR